MFLIQRLIISPGSTDSSDTMRFRYLYGLFYITSFITIRVWVRSLYGTMILISSLSFTLVVCPCLRFYRIFDLRLHTLSTSLCGHFVSDVFKMGVGIHSSLLWSWCPSFLREHSLILFVLPSGLSRIDPLCSCGTFLKFYLLSTAP